ncbi:MAG TPA: serine hydrolase domain-containing protein [Dehalococcoidia bacterium]|nr:serine hydrolase domain-containing protein [Dehalococcoidia bacterium]
MTTTSGRVQEAIEAKPEDVGMSSSRLDRLDQVIQRRLDERKISGAITVVMRHGRVVHFQTVGSMDDEASKPMRRDAMFRIYSMTKPIVSLALMQLFEEGLFQLDDPASKYIPEFAGLEVFTAGDARHYETRPPSREMTVRDLLCHTSGLSSAPIGGGTPALTVVSHLYLNNGVAGIGHDGTLHDTIVKLGRLPLEADPGTRWIYGVSTDVVGYLVEVLSGRPLDQYLRERIFEPLGMPDSSFFVTPAKHDRLAAYYRQAPGGYDLYDAPTTSPFARQGTYFSGVGGLCSTADDYTRFVKMLLNGGQLDGERVIGPRTLAYMRMNHLPGDSEIALGTGFGLGFAVLTNPAASGCVGTAGEYHWAGAASTHFFVSPADQLGVVFMTQMLGMGPPVALGRDLRVGVYQALLD